MKKNQLLLPAAAVLFWYAQYIHTPFQTPFLTSIAVSSSLIGVIIGCYGVTQLLLRVPLGILCDRKGRYKPFILLSCACAAAACLLRYSLPNSTGYLLANLMSGVASTGWICFICAYTGYFPKEQLSKASGTILAGNNLGIFLGYFSGMLLHDRIGLRSLCLTGIAAAVAACLLTLGLQEMVSLEASGNTETWSVPAMLKTIFTNRRVWIFGLVSLVQQGFFAATVNSFTTQVLRDRGADGTVLGLASLVYMAAAVMTSRLTGTRLHRRLGPGKTAFLTLSCCALYCFLIPNLKTIPPILACQLLAGMATGWLNASDTAEAVRGVPDAIHTSTMGAFCAIYALGMMTFPVLFGRVNGSMGLSAAYTCIGVIAALTGIAMLFYRDSSSRSNS